MGSAARRADASSFCGGDVDGGGRLRGERRLRTVRRRGDGRADGDGTAVDDDPVEDIDRAKGPPIVAAGLVWTINGSTLTASTRPPAPPR